MLGTGVTDMTIQVPAQFPSSYPCKIAFVGEFPSDDDVEHGIPFCGSDGRILNSMLQTANLERSEFLITHVFNEQPRDNEIENWCIDLKTAREQKCTDMSPIGSNGFLRPEHRWHLERLNEEIVACRPNVIVPMGKLALWAFTGEISLDGHRGAIMPARYIVPGAKLIPTYAPDFIMKQWKFFSIVVGDFIKAMKESGTAKIILPEKFLLLEPTIQDVRDYVPVCLKSDLLSVDIETGWGQITSVGFAYDAANAICIPLVDLRKPNKSYWNAEEEMEVWGLIKQVMESRTPKLGQNFGMYDAYWFMEKMGIEPRNYLHDTRLLHHALYPELPKDLEFLGANYTQQGAWKSWAKRKTDKKDD